MFAVLSLDKQLQSMFGIRFIKTKPTDFTILFRRGKVKKQGPGLSFFYYSPSASVVIVPADSRDTPFIFKETTTDFQEIDIQGQITYHVIEPVKLASLLDFSVDIYGRYTGDGIEKLPVRLTNLIQVTMREKLRSLDLRGALASASDLVQHVRTRLKDAEVMKALGIEILDFSILKISPVPEMSRALEASARENLLKEADQALYDRRNFAVEQERRIKENELQTQISVEEKNRMIREEQMNAEIAVQEKQRKLEEEKMNAVQSVARKKTEIDAEQMKAQIDQEDKRKQLVAFESENALTQAKTRAEAMRMELDALAKLNPELLEVLASNQMDARKIISRAMRDLAKNAGKIGNLNISPELLTALMKEK